jgi:transcriptional regulator with XRE-family HTH domain
MSNHLGRYFRDRREALGLGRGEVARRLGYANASRGCRRLNDVEDGRRVHPDFLRRLMDVLGIEPQVVQDLIDRDRQEYVAEWHRWADEPVPMQAAVRLIPGFIAGVTIPDGVTTPEQAIAWAVETAVRRKRKVFVTVSRRVSYTIHEDGRVDGPFVATPDRDVRPYTALGCRRSGSHPTRMA